MKPSTVALLASLFWLLLSDLAWVGYRMGYKATMLALKASGWCAFMSNQTFEEFKSPAQPGERE